MKNTDSSFDFLSPFISSEDSYLSLVDMIQDMDLEILDITAA